MSEGLEAEARLGDRAEQVHVEALVTYRPVEAFAEAVLPGAAYLDVGCANDQPSGEDEGDQLRPVVAAHKARRPVLGNEPGQHVDHTVGGKGAGDVDSKTLACVLVHHGKDTQAGAVLAVVGQEVVVQTWFGWSARFGNSCGGRRERFASEEKRNT